MKIDVVFCLLFERAHRKMGSFLLNNVKNSDFNKNVKNILYICIVTKKETIKLKQNEYN